MKNLKHKQFCDVYLNNGLNATKAYIEVYKSKNEESARKAASLLLTNIDVKNYITAEQEKLSKKALVTREEILLDLKILKAMTLDDPKTMVHALKAIEILNKMLGFNEPEKTETKITGIDIKKLLDFDED